MIVDFEVLAKIAHGGMATVLKVRDQRNGDECALKLLRPLRQTEDSRSRFRREFRALSRLQHPNVLRVHRWGLLDDRPWFTMELVDGADLRAEIGTWAVLSPAERFELVESILIQVARALDYIHERGLVHRDVTPGNIMVRKDKHAVLMDFGLVKNMAAGLTAADEVVGTMAYIAPEQINGLRVDARADLYALGTVLYLMLTGRRPFNAHTVQGYMEKHLNEVPRPAQEVNPLVPDALSAICNRLLAKDPNDRYASSAHLLHVLGDTASEYMDDEWPPRSVGRQWYRASLLEAVEDLSTTETGTALLITGGPGLGKTRMLNLADLYARRRGLKVLRGRCRTHDRPFGAFVGVYRDLKPEDPTAILEDALGRGHRREQWERYPVIAAFRDALVKAAPCVVVLDEIEKADPATVELLEYLVRNTLDLSTAPILYVISYECEPQLQPQILEELQRSQLVQRHALGPLQAQEVEELVLSLVSNTPEALALAQRLHKETAGSPAFIADMLRSLADEGVLVRSGMRYTLTVPPEEIRDSHLPMPASLRQALFDRVEPLDDDAKEIGLLVALARRSLDIDALAEASSMSEDRVITAVDTLVDLDIVDEERTEEVDRIELAHSRLRDVFTEPLTLDETREMHRKMGEILERQNRYSLPTVVEDLAFHFEQADVPPKAYRYLVRTAKRHLNLSLHEEALGFLDRALIMEPTARPYLLLDQADRSLAEVYLARSKALWHIGRWAESLEDVRRSESLASAVRDPHLESRIATELGNQLRYASMNKEAESALRHALKKAEEAGDSSLRPAPLYRLGGLMWGQGHLAQAEQMWRDALQTAEQTGNERAQGMGFNGLGILAICKGRTAEARRLLEHAAKLFERLGMLGSLAITRVNLVETYLSMGSLRTALKMADRTLAHAREVNHLHGIALGLAWRAQVLLEIGDIDQSEVETREALRLSRQLGTTEDELLTLSVLVRVALRRDDARAAVTWLAELQPLLEEYDHEGIAPQIETWRARAMTMLGDHEGARHILDNIESPDRPWPHVRVRVALDHGIALRDLGDQEGATEVLEEALELAERCGYRFFQLRAHHELVGVCSDPTSSARHRRVARSLARSLAANLPRQDATRFLGEFTDTIRR